jgi:hypothetical protein
LLAVVVLGHVEGRHLESFGRHLLFEVLVLLIVRIFLVLRLQNSARHVGVDLLLVALNLVEVVLRLKTLTNH